MCIFPPIISNKHKVKLRLFNRRMRIMWYGVAWLCKKCFVQSSKLVFLNYSCTVLIWQSTTKLWAEMNPAPQTGWSASSAQWLLVQICVHQRITACKDTVNATMCWCEPKLVIPSLSRPVDRKHRVAELKLKFNASRHQISSRGDGWGWGVGG